MSQNSLLSQQPCRIIFPSHFRLCVCWCLRTWLEVSIELGANCWGYRAQEATCPHQIFGKSKQPWWQGWPSFLSLGRAEPQPEPYHEFLGTEVHFDLRFWKELGAQLFEGRCHVWFLCVTYPPWVDVLEVVDLGRRLPFGKTGCVGGSGAERWPTGNKSAASDLWVPCWVTGSYRNKGSGGLKGLSLVGTVSGWDCYRLLILIQIFNRRLKTLKLLWNYQFFSWT